MQSKTREQQIAEQIAQYSTATDMHGDLTGARKYWAANHFVEPFRAVTGVRGVIDLYASTFAERVARTGNRRIVSFGSGDGAVELQVIKAMLKAGCDDFTFYLLELSPIQNERAREKVEAAGLGRHVVICEADVNDWSPEGEYAGIMAHHSLHHVVELEALFDAARSALAPQGAFVTCDMIGRNGHMRWPETLEIVEAIWRTLPPEKRRSAIFRRDFKTFYNHDASKAGFEGIRAQDILPELVKRFHFEVFFPYGGIAEIFYGRHYGPHFDMTDPRDRALIDLVALLEDRLTDAGLIKPTMMSAVMARDPVQSPRLRAGRTPGSMVRDPTAEPRPAELSFYERQRAAAGGERIGAQAPAG